MQNVSWLIQNEAWRSGVVITSNESWLLILNTLTAVGKLRKEKLRKP